MTNDQLDRRTRSTRERRHAAADRTGRRFPAAGRQRHWTGLALVVAAALCVPAVAFAATPATPDLAVASRAQPDGEPHQVTFVNNCGETIELRVDGEPPHSLAKGASVSLSTTVARLVYAVVSPAGWRNGGELEMARVVSRTVALTAPGGHVLVINRSGEPVTVFVADGQHTILEADARRLIGPTPVGRFALLARGERSRRWMATELDVAAGRTATVTLDQAAGALSVRNPLDEVVAIAIDKRAYGRLPAGAEVHVLGLVPGAHRVEIRGESSHRRLSWQATFPAVQQQTDVAGAIRLHVKNATGEVVELRRELQNLSPELAPAQEVDWVLPRQAVRLRATGRDSGLPYIFDVRADAPAASSWVIERPTATVQLRNGTGEAAEVTIGDHARVHMDADARAEIRGIPAGRLRITVHGVDTDTSFDRGLFLAAGATASWTVRAGTSHLVVESGWGEPLQVAVDGLERGTIPARGRLRLSNLAPGVHAVSAIALWTRLRQAAEVRIVDGRQTHLSLAPPRGALRLINSSDRRLRLLVTGVTVAEVEPGASHTQEVPPGRVRVEIRDVVTGRSAIWEGAVGPAQHVELPAPALGISPLRLINDSDLAATVRVGASEPFVLAAGAERELVDLQAGEVLIDAVMGSGDAARQERRRVRLIDGQPALIVRLTIPAATPASESSLPTPAP